MSNPTPSVPRPASFVVLGDDLSTGADVAWLWVNSQRWSGWTLIDLQADPPAFGQQVSDADAEPHPTDDRRPPIAAAEFAEVQFLSVTADPRVALSRWPDAGLVVVGEASSGLGSRRIGSTTEWLMRDPTTPVVVARRGRPVERVLICADGSRHAGRAAGAFAALPWSAEAQVQVLSVDDGRTDIDRAIDEVVAVLDGSVKSLSSAVIKGRSPHREILASTDSAVPDMIVLGATGLSTLRALTLGSTASAVAQIAPCSVLVANADGDTEVDRQGA